MTEQRPAVGTSTEPPGALATPLGTEQADARPSVDLAPDASGAKRQLLRAKDGWSLEHNLVGVRQILESQGRHFGDGEGDLAELAQLAEIEKLARRLLDQLALRLASEDYSAREISIALGVARSTVESRYPNSSSRPAGGQPGHLR